MICFADTFHTTTGVIYESQARGDLLVVPLPFETGALVFRAEAVASRKIGPTLTPPWRRMAVTWLRLLGLFGSVMESVTTSVAPSIRLKYHPLLAKDITAVCSLHPLEGIMCLIFCCISKFPPTHPKTMSWSASWLLWSWQVWF